MSAPNDGGPAFPLDIAEGREAYFGMTLRDWFAGQALAGLAISVVPERAAEEAYLYADAMLAERAKGGE